MTLETIQNLYNPQLPTLFLALHPQASTTISSGKKIIEYRKRFSRRESQIFTYTTGKQGAVSLFLHTAPPIKTSITKLKQIGTLLQQDPLDEIESYFAGHLQGYALPILEVSQLAPIARSTLQEYYPPLTIPQSYFFLDRPEKENLKNFLISQAIQNHRVNPWNFWKTQIATLLQDP
ncbi:hypothetical protein HU830_04495 [Lactobacillus sp. DCY120]|uniref:ASCH domain-containing protein n=1 Tax=Bombilactobacillus apium TaxID=2675299 RepID=A0A850R370_9LACO|nr:hypothetical protein [Bombilactobacillus apium]NVY96431.1 hypothetical protein [Bombilactobacillus apium]